MQRLLAFRRLYFRGADGSEGFGSPVSRRSHEPREDQVDPSQWKKLPRVFHTDRGRIRGQSLSGKPTKDSPHGAEGGSGSMAWRGDAEAGVLLETWAFCWQPGRACGRADRSRRSVRGARCHLRVEPFCQQKFSFSARASASSASLRFVLAETMAEWPLRERLRRSRPMFPAPFMHDVSPPFAQFRLANTPEWVILRVLR